MDRLCLTWCSTLLCRTYAYYLYRQKQIILGVWTGDKFSVKSSKRGNKNADTRKTNYINNSVTGVHSARVDYTPMPAQIAAPVSPVPGGVLLATCSPALLSLPSPAGPTIAAPMLSVHHALHPVPSSGNHGCLSGDHTQDGHVVHIPSDLLPPNPPYHNSAPGVPVHGPAGVAGGGVLAGVDVDGLHGQGWHDTITS